MNELTLAWGYIKQFEKSLAELQDKYHGSKTKIHAPHRKQYNEIVRQAYEIERLKSVVLELLEQNQTKLKAVA
jgi:hypothetical protein